MHDTIDESWNAEIWTWSIKNYQELTAVRVAVCATLSLLRCCSVVGAAEHGGGSSSHGCPDATRMHCLISVFQHAFATSAPRASLYVARYYGKRSIQSTGKDGVEELHEIWPCRSMQSKRSWQWICLHFA